MDSGTVCASDSVRKERERKKEQDLPRGELLLYLLHVLRILIKLEFSRGDSEYIDDAYV